VQPRAARYVTAELTGGGVDGKESIEAMCLPDASFDMIIAFHVLEHPEDRRAMRELKRMLRPAGVFVCMVPIIEGWETTCEDPAVLTATDRELHFSQRDHGRYYGRDFGDRLRAAGFAF
jgi:SAM-dependent methyltransferase